MAIVILESTEIQEIIGKVAEKRGIEEIREIVVETIGTEVDPGIEAEVEIEISTTGTIGEEIEIIIARMKNNTMIAKDQEIIENWHRLN